MFLRYSQSHKQNVTGKKVPLSIFKSVAIYEAHTKVTFKPRSILLVNAVNPRDEFEHFNSYTNFPVIRIPIEMTRFCLRIINHKCDCTFTVFLK